jgi:hypothetical protein
MKTVTVDLYTYAELPTDKAKEKAREWYQEGNDNSDELLEWFDNDLPNYGFCDIDRDNITFNLNSCQGDGFSFTGSVYIEDLRKAYDEKLVGDIQELTAYPALFAAHDKIKALGFDVESILLSRNRNYHYVHKYTVDVDVEFYWFANENEEDVSVNEGVQVAAGAFEDAMTEVFHAVCDRFEEAGYADIDYRNSEECIADAMEANDYLFTADGKRASRIIEEG